MKTNVMKYIIFILIFIVGMSIGDLRKDNQDVINEDPSKNELLISLESMEENIIVKLAKFFEKSIRYVFYIIFIFVGRIVKLIFGM